MFKYKLDNVIQEKISERIDYHRQHIVKIKENPEVYNRVYIGEQFNQERLDEYMEFHKERSHAYVAMFNEMNRLLDADDLLEKGIKTVSKSPANQ